MTVGTGVGGGVVLDGTPVKGLSHPEMGHMRVPRHPYDRDFAGICPYHGDCLEGLVCGPAIIARWGGSLSTLAVDHPAHDIVAWYLAQLVITLQAMLEPGRIIFGGGVMQVPGLIEALRRAAEARFANYIHSPHLDPGLERYIVKPGLGNDAGITGAIALGRKALI